jgi:hypothetical protein
LLLTCALIFSVASLSDEVLACACCSDPGERIVYVKPIESYQIDELMKLRFADKSELYTGERDASDVVGISAISGTFDVQVSQEEVIGHSSSQTGKVVTTAV